jgi:hypothetical protein
MGYTYRGAIKDYWPDDTDTEFYIAGTRSIAEIVELAKEKFGDNIDLNDVEIHSEYIHTSCLGYPRYDPGDYTNFTVVTLIKR